MASGGMDLYPGERGLDYGPDSGTLDEHTEYTLASFDRQRGKVALLPATGRVHGKGARSPRDLSASLPVELCQPWVTSKLTKCLSVKGSDKERDKAHHELYMDENDAQCCFGNDPEVWPNVCPKLNDEQRREAEEKYKGFRVAVHQFTTVKLVPVGDAKSPYPTEAPITFDSPQAVSGSEPSHRHAPYEGKNYAGRKDDDAGPAKAALMTTAHIRKQHTVYKVGPPVGYRGGVRQRVPRWIVGLIATLLVVAITAMLHSRRVQQERDIVEKGSEYEQAHFINATSAVDGDTRSVSGTQSSSVTESASSSARSLASDAFMGRSGFNHQVVPRLSGGPFQVVPTQPSAIAGLVADSAGVSESEADEDPLDAIISNRHAS
ncbi:hypothetical protein FOL47_007813 [Perkinsus chesapeaki]|uniref:Uncharacterized protein n=1 Tax=Perkinsus chesapeaki TaxID=330153 RepID=A0A7J6LI18_PERCH|nr:hypothetical protein FOL47_007813 [Perkinsus chesapeaki]